MGDLRRWVAVLGAAFGLVGGAVAAEPSLCRVGEAALFTCALGTKIVSVCSGEGRATYYYGSMGKVEMTSSSLVFAATGFSRGGESQISFRNGAYTYVVYDKTVRTSFSPGGRNDPESTSRLVLKGKKAVSTKGCGSDATISVNASKLITKGTFVEH